MGADVFIALTNPAMSLVFAATFFLLWQSRRQAYIGLLGASFLAIGAGFLLQYFTVYSFAASKLAANLLFLVGGMGFAIGGLARFDCRPPIFATSLFALGGFAGFTWFLLVEPDITWRIYAINFAFGAITLTMAAELRHAPRRNFVDNILLGLLVFYGINFFVRPVVVIWIDGPYKSYDNFHQSLYWITLTFSASLFLLIFALSLITAIALDVMDELRLESHTDPLSGLLNRRGFEQGVAEALQAGRRKRMAVTLVVCDLDHFKSVNDTYGHAAGDYVIMTFADCLRRCIGPNQIVGRIGGEEFAVLLRGGDRNSGRLLAEGVRAGFGLLPVPHLPGDMRFSASFGVAEWREGETVAELFMRADRALYEAKKAGRDRVRVDGLPQPSVALPLKA